MPYVSDTQRIVEDVAGKVAAGVLQPGDQLPSIVQMADQYDTSQSTVKNALLILGARGVTQGRQGKGTFIL